MTTIEIANHLLGCGIFHPRKFEALSVRIMTRKPLALVFSDIQDVADGLYGGEGIKTPSQIEAIGRLVLPRGMQTH
jgi:hypothetical protein